MNIHISIDDVIGSLRWLTYNKPGSMFDMRFFGRLHDWHERCGAKFSLYVFAMGDNFLISEVPDSYAEEIGENSDWLRFGYHSKCAVPFIDEPGYKEGFELVDNTLSRLGAGKDDTLRLHCWYATPEQKQWLAEKGVRALLYPDDVGLFGDGDMFTECGLAHLRTRVRFEMTDEITPETLHIGLPEVYVFTHEWCFDEQVPKIEKAFELFVQSGYEFI